MALKDEHVKLIRETHRNLRRKLAECDDFARVWKMHCSNDRLLQDYSAAMNQLATNVWDVDCDGRDRTKWCKEIILWYFHNDGLTKRLKKDERRKMHFEKESSNFFCQPSNLQSLELETDNQSLKIADPVTQKIELLDVGSCFNPFSSFSEFHTTAIDISPANENVYYCDFLSVETDQTLRELALKSAENVLLEEKEGAFSVQTIIKLPENYFKVVVFSLLLSYIPCPHSRWQMCKKAHKVLTANGLLLIITPDSSHQNRHAALMKKWKNSIESIGFQRIKYEKDKHFHFIAFRKIPKDFIWDKRKYGTSANDEAAPMLNIPQDFNDIQLGDRPEVCEHKVT